MSKFSLVSSVIDQASSPDTTLSKVVSCGFPQLHYPIGVKQSVYLSVIVVVIIVIGTKIARSHVCACCKHN